MVFITEGFLEVAIESWPEWDLNPRPLNSVVYINVCIYKHIPFIYINAIYIYIFFFTHYNDMLFLNMMSYIPLCLSKWCGIKWCSHFWPYCLKTFYRKIWYCSASDLKLVSHLVMEYFLWTWVWSINPTNIYLFKISNRNARKSCFYCWFWRIFAPFSSVSIVDFKQVNIC